MTTKKKEESAEVVKESLTAEEPAVEQVDEFDAEAYFDEPVPFYAFRDNDKYKDDIVVGVNGKIWRIKRGVQVMVPRKVYNVLQRSMDQDASTADMIAEKSNEYAAESRRWN